MTEWTYTRGQLEALNHTGMLVLVIQAEPLWASLADLFNADQRLSRVLLAGYGVVEKLASTSTNAFPQDLATSQRRLRSACGGASNINISLPL